VTPALQSTTVLNGAGVAPAVRVTGVGRDFGAVRALSEVSLDLAAGEIHALVGENGAGKSTLLGLLAGRITPTAGDIKVFGQQLNGGNPRESRGLGVVAIYQELTMIPARNAVENVFLGQTLSRTGSAADLRMRARFAELCAEFDVSIPRARRVDSLSVADQQLIEIMRARQSGAKVVLLDEPTASLAVKERHKLFDLMRKLRADGTAIAFVSHNLDEVLEISDRITVFREGRVVDSRPAVDWTKRSLVREMLGRDLADALDTRPTPPSRRPRTALVLDEVEVPGLLHPVSLDIRAGEVLGVAGLVGSGRTSLLRAIAGLERANGQVVPADGPPRAAPRSPRAARRLGVALLPEDRKGQGLVLSQPAAANVVLGDLKSVATWGLLTDRAIVAAAATATADYGFDSRRLSTPAGSLSGGNQQKLLLGRWRHALPRILLADEPTRGIDLGAKIDILAALRRAAADDGMAVVFVSSELEEVLAVSDRIVAMRDGRVVEEFDCHARHVTVEELLHAAFAVTASPERPSR